MKKYRALIGDYRENLHVSAKIEKFSEVESEWEIVDKLEDWGYQIYQYGALAYPQDVNLNPDQYIYVAPRDVKFINFKEG